jgi:hypothetical protein
VLTERLDDWLPDPQVRTVHRRSARADPEALWRAASELPLREARTLAPLVRWRIPGTPADRTFRGLLASYPFTVLAEDEEERWSLSGMCGRIWTLDRDYPRLEGAEAWRAWSEPGTVKVLFAHWIEGDAIVSEARVKPVDRRAALRLRAIWLAIGRWERLIGAEPLRLAARRAERA